MNCLYLTVESVCVDSFKTEFAIIVIHGDGGFVEVEKPLAWGTE
jgi:hypothetical protein